jgi:hypothetical protein
MPAPYVLQAHVYPASRDKHARAERASKVIRCSGTAVAQRLLAHWLCDNPTLAPQQEVSDASTSAPTKGCLPVQYTASWQEVPLAVRADVQALIMHPGVLALAQVNGCGGRAAKEDAPACVPALSCLISCDAYNKTECDSPC